MNPTQQKDYKNRIDQLRTDLTKDFEQHREDVTVVVEGAVASCKHLTLTATEDMKKIVAGQKEEVERLFISSGDELTRSFNAKVDMMTNQTAVLRMGFFDRLKWVLFGLPNDELKKQVESFRL